MTVFTSTGKNAEMKTMNTFDRRRIVVATLFTLIALITLWVVGRSAPATGATAPDPAATRPPTTPYVPEQSDSWGWPDVEIEEIRLDRDTAYQRFTAGLEKAIEPATAMATRLTTSVFHAYRPST